MIPLRPYYDNNSNKVSAEEAWTTATVNGVPLGQYLASYKYIPYGYAEAGSVFTISYHGKESDIPGIEYDPYLYAYAGAVFDVTMRGMA